MKRLKSYLMSSMEHYGKIKSRQILLTLSDRQLEDAGISRELLSKGTSAWPWREQEQPVVSQTAAGTHDDVLPVRDEAYFKAVADLEGMSDPEVQDMGISRGEIQHAVQFGVEKKAA